MIASICSVLLLTSTGAIKTETFPPLRVEYVPFSGLKVSVGDIALVEGSSFQYYEKGWKQGYWSSAWKPVEITKDRAGVITVYGNSDDGRVANRQTFTPHENGFRCVAEFRWRGDKPAMLEYAVGKLWAPSLASGTLLVDNIPVPMLDRPPREDASLAQRSRGRGTSIQFNAPAGNLSINSKSPLIVLDGRNSSVEWADGKELFWVGAQDREIKPQGTVTFDYTLTLEPTPESAKTQETLGWSAHDLVAAKGPSQQKFPIIPKPKSVQRSGGSLNVTGGFAFDSPAELTSEIEWFQQHLTESWVWEPRGTRVPVTVSINPSVTKENGYSLQIEPSGIKLIGQSLEGARYGIRTLAQLVEAQSGELVVPHIQVKDWPALQWRGVHLFVGPTAVQFQGKLMNRYLAPLKLNKVVLQADRTDWQTTPAIKTAITMSKPDLTTLVGKYNSLGFEPIPLVQSLGHMEWFFANNQNRDLAINPAVPYTLDLRKAAARNLITEIWKEVIEATKPNTIHFGLDEIDNRGNEDKRLTDRLWQTSIPVLYGIAKEHKVQTMMWSDMLLYKGEAIDAAHAPSKESAKMRRLTLNRGTYVADWHYKNDPNPDAYDASLQMWNSLGMKPIAATWFRPKNIKGFTLSAIKNNAGILQTTWAGYESNELNMVREFEQFSAIALMAEYAWSGRTDDPAQFGYQPGAFLQKMYFGGQQLLSPADGVSFADGTGERISIGPYRFMKSNPAQLYGVTSASAYRAPHAVLVAVEKPAKELVLAMDCLARVNDVIVTGQVVMQFSDGTKQTFDLRYGTHLRAISDDRSTIGAARSGTISAISIPLNGKQLAKIEVVATHSAAGMRLHGITVL